MEAAPTASSVSSEDDGVLECDVANSPAPKEGERSTAIASELRTVLPATANTCRSMMSSSVTQDTILVLPSPAPSGSLPNWA
jgi:hypothetical protein